MGTFEIIAILAILAITITGFSLLSKEISELFKGKKSYKYGVIVTGILFGASIANIAFDIAEAKEAALIISAFLFFGFTFIAPAERKVDKESNIQEKL